MENKSIGFALKSIKTEQFATFEENYSKKKEVNLNTDLEFKINKEHKEIGVYTTFTFMHSKKTFIKLEVSCHFDISPDAWNSFLDKDTITFPKGFISHLAMLTVGTSRGVLHSKTTGTEFNQYILPTLNIGEMITTDIDFDFN